MQPLPGPGEHTNGGRANARHVTVILLDMLNQRVATEALAADMIVRHLSGIENPDDLYLYALALDGKVVPIHGLNGAEPVANPQASSRKNIPWTSRIKPLMDAAMQSLRTARPGDTSLVNVRIDLTFTAMHGLTDQLSAYPGRKDLVWITDGLPAAVRASRTQNGQVIDFGRSLRQLGE